MSGKLKQLRGKARSAFAFVVATFDPERAQPS